MLDTGDDFAAAFRDRYVDYGGAIRLLGGDNRPLPVSSIPASGWGRSFLHWPWPFARGERPGPGLAPDS
jgi:hypothetical protein